MRTILITGGSGFVGKNLIEYFEYKDYKILAPFHVDLPYENSKKVDSFFEENEVDIIVHTAIKPYHRAAGNTENLLETNVRMYYNLAKQVEYGKAEKMFITGTGSEYGLLSLKPDMSEEYFGENIPEDEGTFSRFVCAKHIEETDLPIYNLRVFGLFGKYEKYEIRFISNAVCKTLLELPVTLKQNRVFSYLYIDDFCRILERFFDTNLKHKTYNIVPNSKYELLELAKMVAAISGKPHNPIVIEKSGIGAAYSGSNGRLLKEFNDFEFTDMEVSIGELIEYYRSNIDNIDKQKLLVDV